MEDDTQPTQAYDPYALLEEAQESILGELADYAPTVRCEGSDDEISRPVHRRSQQTPGIAQENDPVIATILLYSRHDNVNRHDVTYSQLQRGYVVGRSEDCDLVVKRSDPALLDRHCTLSLASSSHQVSSSVKDDYVIMVEDHSEGGIILDGNKVGRGNRQAIVKLAVIQLWDTADNVPSPFFKMYFVNGQGENPEPHVNLLKDYELECTLGSGAFARVYRVAEKATRTTYACKVLRVQRENYRNKQANIAREAELWRTLDHPNVVKFHRLVDDGQNTALILEYVDGGDLASIIPNYGDTSERERVAEFYQLCTGVRYFQIRNIAHRDLKPENILATSTRPRLLKIADLGLAKISDESSALQTFCGTPNYQAPEIHAHSQSTSHYGIQVGTLLGKRVSNDWVSRLIMDRFDFDEKLAHINDQARSLIKSMLRVNPQRRITMLRQPNERKRGPEDDAPAQLTREMKRTTLTVPEDTMCWAYLVERIPGKQKVGKTPLYDNKITIGWHEDCHIKLRDPQFGMQHCYLEKLGDGFYLTALEGCMCTVNEQQVISKSPVRVYIQDYIKLVGNDEKQPGMLA
ncbi:kinase-like domain-containing protein [Thamnocephalis sphaerospora]|uniref:Kinase-like domain-containing protein n=1 Tax=Thamnocephalis sphaerospora TaxID=78915 RepID=A0A4V1IW39_9FUNG|nr:kinase-like domain-containing protein [Thamnocephalis sphaerospora]|eukprot:RKP06219.1 kinase-like domain-containing protein [Thamnocephalis sphaerospora]